MDPTNFESAARDAFAFLMDSFGFTQPTRNTFANPTAFAGEPTLHAYAPMDGRAAQVMTFRGGRSSVEVAYDPRGDVHVTIVDHRTGQQFSMHEIVRFLSIKPQYTFPNSAETDLRAKVHAQLADLAGQLQTVAGPFLQGHPEAVDALNRYVHILRGLDTAKSTAERRPGTLSHRLHKAFLDRDFMKLKSLLERIPDPRTELEDHALAYAIDQLALGSTDGSSSGDHSA